jgi:hypothetical protein
MTLAPLPSIYDSASLRRWLKKFAPDQVIGVSRDACRCPLYEWLRSETGEAVYVTNVEIRIGEFYYEMPDWAKGFKQGVDGESLPKSTYFKPITAAKAIDALDAAEALPVLAGESNRS